MKRCFLFYLVLLLVSCTTTQIGPDSDLSLEWTFSTGGMIIQSPLIVGNLVIICPSPERLLALDLKTGQPKWTFSPPEEIWERAYASDGKRLFIGLRNASLVALEVSTGRPLWHKDLGANVHTVPLVSDGIVYAPTTFVGPGLNADVHGRARLFALEAETGNLIWAFESNNYILQTPAIYEDMLYVGGDFYDPQPVDEGGHNRIYALHRSDASVKWTYESEDGLPKRIYATRNTVVFVGYQDFMNGIDAHTGQLRWRLDTGNWTPSFLGAGNTVYFSSANTKVFAAEVDTGQFRWIFDIPEGTFNYLIEAPILLNGTLYFITQQGDFFALDAASGELLWQAKTAASQVRVAPAIAHGWLIVADTEGNVYGYR